MLAPRLTELRQRLDALQQNVARPAGMVGWALGLMVASAGGQFPADVEFLNREVGEFLGQASGARRD